MTEVGLSVGSHPESVTTGPDGMIWATESGNEPHRARLSFLASHHGIRHPDDQQRSLGNYRGDRRKPVLHRVKVGQGRPDHDHAV